MRKIGAVDMLWHEFELEQISKRTDSSQHNQIFLLF